MSKILFSNNETHVISKQSSALGYSTTKQQNSTSRLAFIAQPNKVEVFQD